MKKAVALLLVLGLLGLSTSDALAKDGKHGKRKAKRQAVEQSVASAKEPAKASNRAVRDGEAEARLIEIYRLIGQSAFRQALGKAQALVRDQPNFQLAQLVYGDLLASQTRPVHRLGDVPESVAKAAGTTLTDLRQESEMRLRALRERPPENLIPSQFLSLSPFNKHAIAIDASRFRLYLFENSPKGLKLVSDYYISVGKQGIEKNIEGDLRTPLGVYFITSQISPKSLTDFYGSGALAINYPNQLDIKRGKTGSGIWLHGTARNQFARAPYATNGCVVLTNPDLERILTTVEVRSTPVVISQNLKWVTPNTLKKELKPFEDVFTRWYQTKSSGNIAQLNTWYTPDFNAYDKTARSGKLNLQEELKQMGREGLEVSDVSYLRWTDSADTMVVTFSERINSTRKGRLKRQYWSRQGSEWKIFFEGTV